MAGTQRGLRKVPKGKINWRGFAWGEKTCQETPAVLEMRKSKSFHGANLRERSDGDEVARNTDPSHRKDRITFCGLNFPLQEPVQLSLPIRPTSPTSSPAPPSVSYARSPCPQTACWFLFSHISMPDCVQSPGPSLPPCRNSSSSFQSSYLISKDP